MTSNTSQEPRWPPPQPSSQDIGTLGDSMRQVHAQIRLITAANFSGFMELSRSKQRDALLALLASSEFAIDLLDQLPLTK